MPIPEPSVNVDKTLSGLVDQIQVDAPAFQMLVVVWPIVIQLNTGCSNTGVISASTVSGAMS